MKEDESPKADGDIGGNVLTQRVGHISERVSYDPTRTLN